MRIVSSLSLFFNVFVLVPFTPRTLALALPLPLLFVFLAGLLSSPADPVSATSVKASLGGGTMNVSKSRPSGMGTLSWAALATGFRSYAENRGLIRRRLLG